jgi:hypothetical protein
MTTTTQKKKLSKGTWALIFLLVAAVITIAVLAVVGYISLQFLADGIVSYMSAGASSWMMGTLLIALPFLGGTLFTYIIYTYFRGNKVVNTMPTYTPQGQTLSAPQAKDTETVIS